MTIQESLKGHIGAVQAISALIGDRFYALRGPDAAAVTSANPVLAYVVYRFPDIKPEPALDGPASITGQLTLEHYAADYDLAWQVEDAFRAALDYFKGVMGGGLYVSGCVRTVARDEDLPQFGIFKVVSEYELIW